VVLAGLKNEMSHVRVPDVALRQGDPPRLPGPGQEEFLEGHLAAFEAIGGVPTCDPGQITTNHDVGVSDQSVLKTRRSP
jgi:hypothetical protein